MTKPELNDRGEHCSLSWYNRAVEKGGDRFGRAPDFEQIAYLTITAVGQDPVVVQRDKIEAIARVRTGAEHPQPGTEPSVIVKSTILMLSGGTMTLGTIRGGTSDVLHEAVVEAWRGADAGSTERDADK